MENEMRLILAILSKGHAEAVTEAISDMACNIVRVTGSTDSGEKGLFGVTIKEETEIILGITKKENTDEIIGRIVVTGELESFPNGVCMAIPVENMYRPPDKITKGLTDMPMKSENDNGE